jgi:hypothetical protein
MLGDELALEMDPHLPKRHPDSDPPAGEAGRDRVVHAARSDEAVLHHPGFEIGVDAR